MQSKWTKVWYAFPFTLRELFNSREKNILLTLQYGNDCMISWYLLYTTLHLHQWFIQMPFEQNTRFWCCFFLPDVNFNILDTRWRDFLFENVEEKTCSLKNLKLEVFLLFILWEMLLITNNLIEWFFKRFVFIFLTRQTYDNNFNIKVC